MDPLLTGTAITDTQLTDMFGKPTNDNDSDSHNIIFGSVDIDHDEKNVLNLRPEFSIYDKIDYKRMNEEFNTTLTKIRWDRISRDGEDDETTNLDETWMRQQQQEMKEELEREDDARSRMTYDSSSRTIDMGARRATDMSHNTRLILPQPRPAGEEALLSARQQMWRNTTTKYISEHCNRGGDQNEHNMTTSQRVGLAKLEKRVRAGEVTVLPSDKGNRLTISSNESYERQGDLHTTQDRKISRMELEQCQTRMNVLSRGLSKVFKVGANWGG